MSDVSQTEVPGGRPLPGETVDQLAARALNFVARRQRGASERGLVAQRLHQLQTAVTATDPAAAQAAVRDMVRAGIPPDVIAERYIPEVARRLGEMWCTDATGFAVVTIGSARLQGLLRVIDGMTAPQRRPAFPGTSVLVVVPEGIHHTLGAMVLTGQMRRWGHGVHLLLGAEPAAVRPVIAEREIDVVMISAPQGTRVETLRPIVRAVRSSAGARLPVVIGGTLLEQVRQTGADICQLTGADHATCDPGEALRLCGQTSDAYGGAERGQGH